jgi:hypothetical protein
MTAVRSGIKYENGEAIFIGKSLKIYFCILPFSAIPVSIP